MKINRTKNAGKNMVFELMKNLYGVIMPFIIRTAMIHCLGIEYTGLGGLFSSILDMLNLVELGVGSAMVFSMYKPIAEDDQTTICALMRLYKIYYRVIGIVICSIGLILTPFIDKLISGSCPEGIDVHILFLMNLSVTVLSYWLFAYRNCLLQAHQQTHYATRMDLGLNIVFSLLQLGSLIVFKNYYIYMLLNIVRQILSNIIQALITKKIYPLYVPKGRLEKAKEKDIQRRTKDLFTAKLGNTITNSADAIIISSFLGLTLLAQYQNYYYIFSAVLGIIGIVYNSTRAGIGNSLVCESIDKNIEDLKLFTFIIMWILTFCVSCFLGLYQTFIGIWIGDKGILPFGIVICLCVMFVFRYYNCLLMTYKDAAGAWHEDRFRPLIAGVTNLFVNIILVQFMGLYGVLISTILSEGLIEVPWLVINIFRTVFKKSPKEYIKFSIGKLVVAVVVMAITGIIVNCVPSVGVLWLVIRLCIVILTSNCLLVVIYFKNKYFKETIKLAKKMIFK